MTILIALVGLFVYAVLFFVLPKLALICAPLVLLFVVWKKWQRSRLTAIALAVLLGGLPAWWIHSSISQFKTACASARTAQIFSIAPPQDGFLLDSYALRTLAVQKFISPDPFFEKGPFTYVEEYVWPPEYARAQNLEMAYTRRFAGRAERVAEPLSSYIFSTEVVPRGAYGAPLYLVQHSIRRISDDSAIATATDIVFGGGIIGSYLALFGGYAAEDQDAVFVSCGYAGSGIGAWRPNNVAEPRWAQYREADQRFLSSVLKQPSVSGGG